MGIRTTRFIVAPYPWFEIAVLRVCGSRPMAAGVAEVLDGCPQSFLRSNNRCLSPRSYCLAGHQGDAYCHALDGAISSCSACPGGNRSTNRPR